MNKVGLFFYVNGEFLFHSCKLADAEHYGDFLIYPESHFDIWEKYYEDDHKVDFDYHPRGRVVYNKIKDEYIVYYDRCLDKKNISIKLQYDDKNVILELDEHYQCHMCNPEYVFL